MAATAQSSNKKTKQAKASKDQGESPVLKAIAKTDNPPKNTYDKETLQAWYHQMLLMRRFEERANQLYVQQQKIRGFLHLYIGQEAVGTGLEAAMRPEDYLITGYRDHGNALARGISPREVMAELFGKATGCTKGKGGSMHMFSREKNFFGGHGIVGAQIGLGTGMAFAQKYRGEDNVTVAMFGDGAARQGMLHETFNMAMLWNLPVLYIVENNNFAMGTSVERSSNVTELYTLGENYDMARDQIDGMNVFTVYEGVKAALEHIRNGNGPYFLEIKTYRYKGHSVSDPASYRTREELEQYKERDPIIHLKHYLTDKKLFTADELEAIDKEVKEQVKDAVQFAEESPLPDPKELFTDVYTYDYPYIQH